MERKEINSFNTMYNVGKAKYVINYHTVGKYHKDGSEFFDINIFNNKKKFEARVKELKAQGYTQTF